MKDRQPTPIRGAIPGVVGCFVVQSVGWIAVGFAATQRLHTDLSQEKEA